MSAAAASLLAVLAVLPGRSAAQSGLQVSADAALDAVELRRNGSSERGIVAQLRPGVQLASRGGRVQGQLSYVAEIVQRTGQNAGGELNHNLASTFTAQPVEDLLFVEGSASVQRRAISAFGTQTRSGSLLDNGNDTDLAQATLKPSLRGRVGDIAGYEASVFHTLSRSSNSSAGDSDDRGASVALRSLGGQRYGWSIVGSEQRSDYRLGRETVNQRVLGTLTVQPDIDWQLVARAGRESTDVVTFDRRSYDNYGAGVRWTPSPRTSFSADIDERYFGKSWQVSAEWRMARSAFRLTSTRDASNNNGLPGPTGSAIGASRPITLFELFFQLFASVQPDEELRRIAVLDFLRSQGLDENAIVAGGFTNPGISLQRRTDLSWTLSGLRLSVTLQAFVVSTRTIDAARSGLPDDAVDQRGYTANVAWRLSPTASIGVSGSLLGTSGSGNQAGNTLKSLSVTLGERLGERTGVGLSLRHTQQRGNADPYRESAVGATLSHRF